MAQYKWPKLAQSCWPLTTLKQQRKKQIDSFEKRVDNSTVTHQSSRQDKIKLFRTLFKGREDVYPKRFVSSKTGLFAIPQ
ncbi:MAG TPA: hypothetical protein DCZ48_04100 [Methylococcaceae bacterium]|nr:hypothetical protein [Methylococcaceae bacterium]